MRCLPKATVLLAMPILLASLGASSELFEEQGQFSDNSANITFDASTEYFSEIFISQRAKTPSIVGRWTVVHQGSSGPGRSFWEIRVYDNQLSIVEFYEAVQGVPLPGDYRKPLQVYNVRFSGQQLGFVVEDTRQSVTTEYDLAFTGSNRIEGYFRRTDQFLRDQGILGGDAGVIMDAGTVIMTREQR